jgi:ribonucleotide monophosphatase NagD (HAD superfamily)
MSARADLPANCTMKKIIIFDFNRTIYDPDSGSLFPEAVPVLEYLQSKNIGLYIYGKGDGKRAGLIESLNIKEYFIEVILKEEKSVDDLKKIIENNSGAEFYIVGDRVKKEIKLGNSLGMNTIWFKNGKFAEERAENADEEPQKTIFRLEELKEIF